MKLITRATTIGTGLLAATAAVAALALAPAAAETRSLTTAGEVMAPAGPVAAPAPSPAGAPRARWAGVPRAECRASDRPETGLQGQVPRADRANGRSREGYRCNAELIGQLTGEGAHVQFAAVGTCGYFNTQNGDGARLRGTVVVDSADPTSPRAATTLADGAFLQPWESLKVNERRGLLAGVLRNTGVFSVYDVRDCARPRLLARKTFPDVHAHAGAFSPDGLTYYIAHEGQAKYNPPTLAWSAIDLTDPTDPALLYQHPTDPVTLAGWGHDLSVSADGTRLYAAQPHPGIDGLPGQNGLVVLDVSDIQQRVELPAARVVGSLYWKDGSTAQVPLPVTIGGRRYLVFTDEMGSGGFGGTGSTQKACAMGLPPFGFARIIDVSDETRPVEVSRLTLEVHDPANCAQVMDDEGQSMFGYDSHYCAVDNARSAHLLACSYFQSGLRVFDISNPAAPREVAYYNPPARPVGRALPGSFNTYDPTVDLTPSTPYFRADGREIWFTSTDNGFQVIRLANAISASDADFHRLTDV